MADLPSILGGMAQGFIDFGKGAVDLFGTGGAAVGDLVDTIRTGKVSTKNQDDFRKWLYNTDSVQDAAAKGLGTALNGVQTVTDYIPGIGAVTRNPLFNAGQGALGGLADEFKTYGKDYDLGRAGQRAAVSAGAALASGSLGDALKKSANPLLSSGAVQGLARGATSGAISGGGYAAIDGGDIAQSALQGAGTGALIGGATGAIQDFMPRKATYDMALTDEEKAARIANAKNMLANEQNPERIAELNSQIKDLGGTLADADMAVNSPRYITDENGNPMTLYHGSPNKNITEFDINQAGKNTRSGERALYFTDSPEVADEFSYERIPTDSLFVENRGAKGKVYPVNLEMNNPLDLDNLTDAQIDELWPYASYMGSWQGKDVFTRDLKNWRDVNNAQLIKGYLDMDKLAGSPYDGFMARMYPNQDNQAREYAVFDNSKIKMLDDLQAVNDANIMASRMKPGEPNLGRTLANQDLSVNSAPETAAVIAGKNRGWDELYDMLSKDAGAFENEDRTPIAASPSQLRSEIQAIDAKYPNDMPDDIWDKRYGLNQQLKAAEKGYNSPYDYYVGESKKNFRQDFESRPDKYKAKIADIESQARRQAALDQDIANASPRKLAQFNLIQQKNPAPNETLTWIRSPKDILTWDEAIAGAEGDNAFTWPDYTLEDALRDQKKHSMTVYSSYPIKGGTFVTPSRQQASDYAGGGRVYSKVIRPDDVAWINGDEGQYAYTRKK